MDPIDSSSEKTEKRCPRCDADIPADAPEGLCPRCIAAGNLLTGSFLLEAPTAPRVDAPSAEEIGKHFPQLEIQALLGRGGMGLVYRARQKALDRLVALKLLAPERAGDPAFAARFAAEAQALARLHHPHIVTIHDFGQAGGYYFLLMEHVDGLNLRQLQAAGRIEAKEALAIVPQICEALQYAHDRGVVHRDIKPENILVDREGRVKVADFGLARLAKATDASNDGAEQMVMGTPGYMAPEQRERPGSVDHRADIYALGAVFYEMLTGRRPETPFAGPSTRVRIDVRLDEVVLRALEKEPARRWQQAGEVKTRVETIATTQTFASGPAPLDEREARATKWKREARWRTVGALACAVALGWFFVARSSVDEGPRPAASAAPEALRAAGEVVDLSAHFTPEKFGAKDVRRALETLAGPAEFDGLPFSVDGQITLAGDEFKERNPRESYPGKVEGIALGGRIFDELHLLHVTYWENPYGEPVATLRLRYADGGSAEFPLRYGVEVRDWSRRNSEEHERIDDPDSKVVKRDLTRNQHRATTRITKTRLLNPRPAEPVRSMELVAAPGLASYSLLAATTAKSDPRRATTAAVPFDESEEDFNGEMLVRVVDRASGAPVPGALIKVGGDFSGARVVAEPLRTDERGEATLRYPKDNRVRTFSLNLTLVQSGSREAWLSWERDYPRVAYFMTGEASADANGLDPLGHTLPEWRRPIARRLLAELGRNAIAPTLANPSGRVTNHDELAFDDLGSLAQGTRGAVFFKAAKTQEGGPEGSDFQNLEMRDPAAYEALHGARDAARKVFLDWMWTQASPDAAPLGEWAVEKPERPASFRALTEEELASLLDAVTQSLDGRAYLNQDLPPSEPWEFARKEAVDALMERLRGTALDHWLELNSQLRIGEEPAFGPSVRVYDLLGARIESLAERGAIGEIRLRVQERAATRDFIVRTLMRFQHSGELGQIMGHAGDAPRAAE